MANTTSFAIDRNKIKGFIIIIGSFFLSIAFIKGQPTQLLTASSLITKTSIDWSFVTQMGDTKYVDFAQAPFRITEIQVLSINKELLFRDQVNDLPNSTLYEISLPNRLSGFYVLHVKGQRQAISKLFYIKQQI